MTDALLMLFEFHAPHNNSPKCQPSALEGTHLRLQRFEPKPPKRKYAIGGVYFEASFSWKGLRTLSYRDYF